MDGQMRDRTFRCFRFQDWIYSYTTALFIIFFSRVSLFLLVVFPTQSFDSFRPSVELAEEVEQSAVELAGFVHVTGVSCSRQLHRGVMGQLNQVLMRLGAQVGV